MTLTDWDHGIQKEGLDPTMSAITPPTLACCVVPGTALRLVQSAVVAEGARTTVVGWEQLLLHPERPFFWAGLIYDLEPRDSRTHVLVSHFRACSPGAPILIYAPMAPDTGRFLEQLAAQDCVCLRLQCAGGCEAETLRDDVRRLLNMIPGCRLEVLIRNALPSMPARLYDFTRHVLATLATQHGALQLSTATVAGEMGLAVRTLERASTKAGYPTPKELLSWLVLLYITLLGSQDHISPHKVGRRLGLSTCTTNRLRQRLLTPQESEEWKKVQENGGEKVRLVFRGFVARCGGDVSLAERMFVEETRSSVCDDQPFTPLTLKRVPAS